MEVTKYRKPPASGNGQPVFVDGVRTAFVKSFGVFEDCESLDLFSRVIDGLVRKLDLDPMHIDEVIAGAVIPQTKNPNVARDAVLSLGLPRHIHGYTLNRACTSSLQSITDTAKTIKFGQPSLALAGGVEVLSDVPIVYSKEARKFLIKLSKAKSPSAILQIVKNFSAKAWVPKSPALAEPLTGLTMGEHAEIMAKKNGISREEQDSLAVMSHRNAAIAQENGYLDEEIVPLWPGPRYSKAVEADNIIRKDSSLEAMAKLRPAFDKKYGTLTAANSSPLTDGASIGLVGDAAVVERIGLKAKTKIVDFDFVGVDPMEQLLIGPAITIPRILKRNNLTLDDIDRFEIHEAFAAQVLSCTRSMASASFCETYFGDSKAFGEVDMTKVNVNGGAIAIGHPFGATGMRLLTSLSNELIRSDKQFGLIAICAAGGMAASLLIERV